MAQDAVCSIPPDNDLTDWIIVEAYKHQALPSPDHIRLLLLQGGYGQIHCELHSYALSDCPLYTAVSYRRDDQMAAEMIVVDGAEFPARENLLSCLQAVRQSTGHRLLWIDAICIDQGNLEERNRQVKLMGQIYSDANEVLAWLGNRHDTMAVAFDFLSEKAFEGQDNWQHRTCTYQSPDERWNALREFFDLTYWTDRWIVQEIVVAKNVVLQHRGVRIPLSTVEEVFNKFDDNPWHSQSDKGHWAAIRNSGLALLCQHRLSTHRNQQPPYSLSQLMRRYQSFKCKEPRDKIYALSNLTGRTKRQLRVDYSSTILEVFVDALCFMHTFEGLPACDVIGVGALLRVELGILQKPESPKLQAQLDEKEAWKDMTASIFARGTVVEDISTTEAENVLSTRDQLEGLRRLAPVVLRRKGSRLVMSPITASWGDRGTADFVSGEELCSFTCRSSKSDLFPATPQVELTGLASCRVKDGDQVWQFHDTRLAFIVREFSDGPTAGGYVIVGRASLIKQWRPCEWDAFQSTPEARKWLKSHEIQLSMASLLDLVFWSSSTDAR
jgi:hypothetical protein